MSMPFPLGSHLNDYTRHADAAGDRTWLAMVTTALNRHWLRKNAAKRNFPADALSNCRYPTLNESIAGGD
jgi:hypothetical protein